MPPAARLTDITVHGSPLLPGTGSMNVLIGGLPAWRAMSPAAVAGFLLLVAKILSNVNKLATAISTNNVPAATKIGKDLADQVPQAVSMIGAMDKIVCPMLLLRIAGPPHGMGVMLGGSQTVLINNLPAGRVGDQIRELLSPEPNSVAVGCPTVIIGDSGPPPSIGQFAGAVYEAFKRASEAGNALVCKGPCAACGHA
jgi:uncharacterized Zn-binding protein involved in type VI secretion